LDRLIRTPQLELKFLNGVAGFVAIGLTRSPMPKATIEIEPTRSWEVAMEKFVRQQNILFFRKQLAETPHEARRLQILRF
jgi:hypothetical protein